MTASPLPFSSIENEFLRLDYLTTTGPRIIGLFAKGIAGNLLAETPDVHWSTPHGEYYLRGGHRLCTAPEDLFYTCPEESVEMIEQSNQVILKSPVDASGLQREITIDLENNKVHLSHCITWHGGEPITFAPWAITQLRLGGMAILPLSKSNGLQPDRNFVLWPYSEIKDNRLELHDDLILVHARKTGKALKVGSFISKSWIAYTLGNAIFIKRFTQDRHGNFPDMGCNVEIHSDDNCIELETLGSLTLLENGASMTHKETWEILTGEYPATLDTASHINQQLFQS